jgi:hypothetical protein
VASCLRRFIALVLTAVMLTGCSSSYEPSNGNDPPPASPVTVALTIYGAEWDADKILMGVGDYSTVEIGATTTEGCAGVVPCWIEVTDLTLASSDPAVVTLEEQNRLLPPSRASLVPHAPGTATVTVRASGGTESRQVTVVANPPLADSIHVETVVGPEGQDPPAQYDASHNLISVEIGGGWYPFKVRAFRGGKEIFGHPTHASPEISTAFEVRHGCRPTRIDTNCLVLHDFWVHGINPGDVQLTVWGRYSCGTADPNPCPYPSSRFTVHVPGA